MSEKKIIITGKKNIDGIKNTLETGKRFHGKKNKRKTIIEQRKKLNVELTNEKNQIEMLNKIYLEQDFSGCDFVCKEIKKKISGYKRQDINKKRHNPETFITYDECLEKMVAAKLQCHYCLGSCILIYENVREGKQWTLDRLNNDINHSSKNTVISCLKCNLKKRTTGEKAFQFAKQVKIIKGF